MKLDNLQNMRLGWFIGNFEPNIVNSEHFEVCVKRYLAGEKEPDHFQNLATEVTLVIEGKVRMNETFLEQDDIILLEPLEVCDFEALTDAVVVAVKFPSLPNDKVLA